MRNVYADVTNRLLAQVDSAGQWRPCWHGMTSMPANAVTKRRYSGINVLLLWAEALDKGYPTARWATLPQWNQGGCKIRKGERSTEVCFFGTHTKDSVEGDKETYRVARFFKVFNAAQVEGPLASEPPPEPLRPGQRLAMAEKVIADTGAVIRNDGFQPMYVPSLDEIRLPLFERFTSPEGYYATAFHELGHWTGAKHRLDRDLTGRFGSNAYAMEELVAELCAAFVCASLQIETQGREDHAAYLKTWLAVAKADKGALITAAAAASKAADRIILPQPEAVKEAA